MPVRTRKIKNQGVHNLFSPYRYQHFADSVRLCFQQTSLNGCFTTLLCPFNTHTATTPKSKKGTEKRTFQTIAQISGEIKLELKRGDRDKGLT